MNSVTIVTQWEIEPATDPSPVIALLFVDGVERQMPAHIPLRGQEGMRFLLTPAHAEKLANELLAAAGKAMQ